MNALEAVETVLDEDHHHDCARLTVAYPSGDFSLEFATGTTEPGPVWNIASDPPGGLPPRYDVLDGDNRYVVVASEAETADEALAEAEDLAETIAGLDAEVVDAGTFEMFKGARELFGSVAATDYLVVTLAGLAGAMFVGAITGAAHVLTAFVVVGGIAFATAPWWSFNYERGTA